GADQLFRSDVRGREEDRLARRRCRLLAHHQVQHVLMSERTLRWPPAAIALLALASSAIGIVNQFTYDDRYIIEKNPLMRSLSHWWRVFVSSYWPGAWGGDGYRPLTILSFRIEYVIGHGNPMVFHAVNIALYLVASVMMLTLARRLLPEWAAWFTAAAFA